MAKQTPKLSAQILDEASVWFTESTAGGLDAVAQAEFNDWLRRSPEHVQAYLQISAFWEDADLLNKPARRDLAGLIARARQESNIYPLERAARADQVLSLTKSKALAAVSGTPSDTIGTRRRSLLALAASAALVIVGAGWLYLQRGVYATDIGEQRSITLDDGSSIELNALSRVKVRFTASQRNVELSDGQALFRVAKDAVRPFVVKSGETSVRAVGTQFDVYRKHGGTIVTVVEGRVAVAAASRVPSIPEEGVLLGAGEQLTVSANPTPTPEAAVEPKPHPANLAVATAWTQKQLVFEGTPLRDVVEEFNRYNRRQLIIQDPSLYDFHVSGVFSSTDSARMLDILRRRFRVIVNTNGDDIAISRPAENPADIESQ